MSIEINLGATYLGDHRCCFRVWAPFAEKLEVRIVSPRRCVIQLQRDEKGYYESVVEGVEPGSLYFYRLHGEEEFPDPASRFQPEGVHGPSQVVDHRFHWEDADWTGLPLLDSIFYELHVGTFTEEGTFDALIPRLQELKELGVTNIEIMPVAQFPGNRNWGYDGVQPFAVQNSYGGPNALKRLVNACHKHGLAVTLDVVYNHFGPEGNYLKRFGPYFTGRYNTPWGDALNFDDEYSDEVRNYFIQNALYWFKFYRIDALRLDAVHAIYDQSATPFLRELAEQVEEFWQEDGWQRFLIAESDLNDSRLIRPREAWGYGLDAQWADDFHHSLHSLLTGERQGYYSDFGKLDHLVTAIREGFVYSGQYSPYRKRRHGNLSADRPAEQFVIATQNHDQVGNRMLGERLSSLISFEKLKLAAGALILSPALPLIFMGEEYGEEAPFLYFVSHTDADLIEAVRRGRKEEFKGFKWLEEPPDPAGEETFLRSKLQWEKRGEGKHKTLLQFYGELLRLRRETPALSALERSRMDVVGLEDEDVVVMRRWWGESAILCLFNFSSESAVLKADDMQSGGAWRKIIESSDRKWNGPGATLPDTFTSDESMTIREHTVAVFTKVVTL